MWWDVYLAVRKPILLLRRLLCDKRGLSAVTVAVSMPVLFGVAGLGVDAGLWYTIKRQNQSAADAAALSAAHEVMAGNTNVATNLTPAATEAATRNNYGGTTPIVTYPYSDAVVASGVRVTLSQTQNAWFSSYFPPFSSVTIANQAVAVVETLPGLGLSCLTALSPTGIGVSTVGSSVINMPNCIITADSTDSNSVYLQGGANSQITAQTIVSAGGIATTGSPVLTLSDPAQVGASPAELINPYAPDASGNCSGSPCLTHTFLTTGLSTAPACSSTSSTISGLATLTWSGTTPGTGNCVFNGTQQIKAPGGIAWNLSPGTYWINNGDLQLGPGGSTSLLECLACNGTNLGVTIIFTTTGPPNKIGTVLMQSSSAQIGNLNAPNAGTFAGLLFVQDTVAGATYTQNGTLQGGPNVALVGTGLIYFPNTNLNFQGTPTLGTNGCLIVYANTVALQGNSTLAATGCTAAGLGGVPRISRVYLAE
jgi:Flp pilus assembly protein TadG